MILKRGDHISRRIVLTGTWEPHVTKAFRSLVRPASYVLDVGANMGWFSLLAASIGANVTSIEPDSENFRLLAASTALNGLEDRLTAIHCAASDNDCVLELSDLGYGANSGARFVGESHDHVRAMRGDLKEEEMHFEPVAGRRLDDVVAEGQRVDLVKIDIEGYELHALPGMVRILEQDQPVVFSEFAPNSLIGIGGSDPADYFDFFQSRGYRASCVLADGSLRPMSAVEITSEVERREGEHVDLLWRPADT